MYSSLLLDVKKALPSIVAFYMIFLVMKNPSYMGEDIASYVLVAALTIEKLAGVLAVGQTMEAGRASGSTSNAMQIHAWSFLLINAVREIAHTDLVQDSEILDTYWTIVPIILLLGVIVIGLLPQNLGFYSRVLKGSSLALLNVAMDSMAFSILGESWSLSKTSNMMSWDTAKNWAPYMLVAVLVVMVTTGIMKNIFHSDEKADSSFDQKFAFVSLQVASWIIQACALAYGKARFNGLPTYLTPLSNSSYQGLLIGSSIIACLGMKYVYKRLQAYLSNYEDIDVALGLAYIILCISTIGAFFSPVVAAGSTQKGLDLVLDSIGGDVLPIISPIQGFISSMVLYHIRGDAGITECRAAYKEVSKMYGGEVANNQATCFEAVVTIESYMQIIPGITIGIFMYYMIFWGRDFQCMTKPRKSVQSDILNKKSV